MEVISIDDPVNTIPSDSLINGELLSNPNPPFSNHPPTKLIPASLVTKDGPATVTKATPPVSIIERIIYSITAISTATPDLNVDLTNDGPTKSSAILKIPSKTTKEDVTFNVLSQHKLQPETVTTNEIIRPLTTERPTTIIERILSSISAIQASSTTERTQVGNILSSVSTNPLPQNLRGVTASVSSTTISTLSSSSATPLGPALDEIEELSSEQAEQQRTISKLLALLKSITPNTSSTEDVVVVTPKSKASSTPDISINNDVEVFNISSNLNPAIPERSSTGAPATDTTTPDVAQNTIAQNTVATESSTSEPIPTVNLNSRLLGPVSISDFIATLDSLNNIEATTPITANAIIESTTTSSPIESGTAIPSSTIEAVTTTLVETANLVTEATSSVNPAAESSTESANLDSNATIEVEQKSANVESTTPALLERLAVDTQEANAVTPTNGATTDVEQNVENSTPATSEQGSSSTEANAVTSTSGATPGVEQTSANVENSTPALLERLAVDTQEGATTEANAATSTTGVEQTPASVENSTPTVTEGTSTAVNAVTSTNGATPGVGENSANVENTTPALLARLAVDTQEGATTEASAPTPTSGATTGVEQNSANVENSTPALLERLAVDTQAGATIEANAATSTTGASTGVEQTPASVENSTPTVSEGVSTAANVVTFTSVATILDAGVEQTPANVETSTPAVLERLAVATTTETNAATSTNGAANLDTTATPGVEQNVDQGSGSTEANAAIQNSTGADVTTEGANVETSTPAISERLADVDGAQNIETTPEQTITTEAPSTTPADKTSSTPNPTTILAMLTRLLELADRAQTLTTLTLEQTTVSTIPESSSVNDGTTSLPTLTTLGNFEVSPGSVTVFSANDLSSMSNLSVDDGTTITISSRSFLTTSAPSTEASITQTIPPTNNIITTLVPSISDGNLETSVNSISSSSDNPITSTVPSGDLIASTIAPADVVATTVVPQDLTTIPAETETMPSDVTTIEPSSINNNDSSTSMSTSTVTNVIITTQENASNVTVSERAGRVLALPEEVVRNDIQTSSEPPEKDFYVFGILPNNTILRKRPSMYPNKRTPFIIVGVYPNNTVIQKFPNGTQIPPEPVIQVSGFDTRDNPPPLPEITSNQVTQDSSVPQDDNKNLQTAVASRIAEAGQPETTAAPSTLPPETTTAAPAVTTTSPPITTTTAAPVVTTTSPPPIATTSPSVAESGGQPTTTVKDAKNDDGTKDVEEINIEENTISNNNGNTKAEKIVEKPTTTQAAPPQTTVTTPAPTTTAKPQIVATTQPTNQQITESAAQPTTILAAIRIDDLEDVETTLPAIDMTTVVPDLANRFGTNPPTTLRYTNTATTVIPPSEALQLTIRPTTPYLIQRIIGNVTGIPVRIGGLATETPVSTIPTEIPTTRFSMRSRFITTIPRAMTAPTTVEAATTEIPTTIRNRGRSRYTLFVPNDSRTVTVTPSTISTQQPGFDDYPIRTTYTPRRFTQTPATITVPSKIATSTPTNIPTATEQYFLSTTSLGLQNAPSESSTVFPIYTSAFDFTTETPSGITQQEVTTNTLPTFASTFRPRQRTTTSFATTREDLEKLVELRVRNNFGELSTGGDFYNPTTVSSQISSTTAAAALQTSLRSVNSKVKQLTEQQIKDLEELARLEKEQAAILQQLAFLTRLAGTPKPTRSNSNNNLAGRVLDFAANRNKQSTTQKPPNLLEALTNQNPKQVESKSPSLEEILKQFNVNPNAVTVSSLTSTYGKSTDAILAALLKERGIEPSTPKTLGELDELRTTIPSTTTRKATTTRRRIVTTTTTARPGPIMQGLNWLLNALAPAPTTKKPQTRKVASTPKSVELISSQPTEITQVAVTAPPRTRSVSTAKRGSSSRYRKPLHSLSESELKNLVGQLEAAQKDPSKAKEIDFSALGYPADSSSKPTNLLSKNAVQITNSGNIGTTSKIRAVADSSTKQAAVVPLVFNRGRSTTAVPAVVSNSIADDVDEETTTVKQRRLPPVQLNPVPGIDGEDGTQVRGQLINAAVNVTRAISQFLGSAIQGAAQSFQSFIGSGSRQVGNYFAGSSISSSRPG